VVDIHQGRFGYRGQVGVDVGDLRVVAGEVVALLGPNGSGKSTLLKGMLGLVERFTGSVQLLGRDVDELVDRARVGYLPQRQSAAGPIPVTVAELVRSGLLARRRLLARPGRTGRTSPAVASAIAAVGLTDQARRAVSTLSGGQQRRALFARALVGGGELLLLDEPFAGVDQANQEAIADALGTLIARGTTVVVVLHELGPLEPLVTRVLCLDAGTVRFNGPIADAPAQLLHLGHDHDPHGGPTPASGLGLVG